MLTVAEEVLLNLAAEHKKKSPFIYLARKSTLKRMPSAKQIFSLKAKDRRRRILSACNKSTLSNDAFPSREFDFMLSNPPYGKSWKSDLERMGGKTDLKDPRFVINHGGDPEYKLVTRSSDGQLTFLVNKLSVGEVVHLS